MDFFDPFSSAFWQTAGVAVACGSMVGLERQLRGKPAGVRTSVLICLSTAVFVELGLALRTEGEPRVLGQIVTGVGFIGAGVILAREGVVMGVTTAAVIWMLAGIGCAIGFGQHAAAIVLASITVAVLIGIDFLESHLRALTRGVHGQDRGGTSP